LSISDVEPRGETYIIHGKRNKPNACQRPQGHALCFSGYRMYTVSGPEEEADADQTMRGVVGGTKLFNRFTLQKVLGRGGMGIVWLARDERLDRLVALKLVPEAVCFDASAQEDLKRETRKSLMLTHPNIVRIFDFIEDEHAAAISMEYVDGSTLSSLRVKKPTKCFEVIEVGPWVTSLCDALTYAHDSASLIHRDLKPSNLMVNSRLDLKITDFGIAVSLRDSMGCVSVRTSSGTLNYMSPQQLLGEDPSPADDIYAVGATLYEMLSSKPPFFGGDVASQVREVIAPTITQRRAKFGINGQPIPKYWEETIAGCIAKNPEQRPRTAADIARRLRLGGTVRLADVKPDKKLQLRQALTALRDRVRAVDPRIAAFAGGVMSLIAALILVYHQSKPSPPVAPTEASAATAVSLASPPRKRVHRPAPSVEPVATVPPVAYAIEKPVTKATPPPAVLQPPPASTTSASPTTETSELDDDVAAEPTPVPAPRPAVKNATLQLTTTPTGATFTIYPGVIAGKTAPGAAPMRTGETPNSADLPPGRYTLFFHSDGWPEDRAEISVTAGESVPVDYTFPHGSAVVTSTPDGAEIFFGTHSLGNAPVTVDLPLGKQKLTARLPDFPDRTMAVTISSETPAKVAFAMRIDRTRSRAKATPTPSALDKIGQSFKHIFGSKEPTPAPKKKR
jgi:serine/threonine protein kinase